MPLTAHSRQSPAGAESGFSLIEVMVTIVIVSFGLLGLAGLLFSSINAGHSSMSHSIAVNLANEMADRIRANWQGIKGGAFDAVSEADYADLSGGCVTTCMTGSCSAVDQAKLDICLWKAQVQKQLPAGVASIAVDAGNLGCKAPSKTCSFNVTLKWNDNAYRSASAGSELYQNASTSYSVFVQP